ncbi:MAG: YdeI/OmpD-associated family protein, partial [Prolixibacteraceae bacterium]|nr:YdeI/OmpD-associated family protein [Prolixibacteraceae bacterium]
LVKYSGSWRLYLNTPMRTAAKKQVGDMARFKIAYDPVPRIIEPHPKLVKALNENAEAKTVFENLSPSLQHEIVRYISYLKTDVSVERNVKRAINFLLGRERFVGRDKPA